MVNTTSSQISGMGMNINHGWVCPKCGAVMAPWVAQCMNCSSDNYVTNTVESQKINLPQNIISTNKDLRQTLKDNFANKFK